MAATSFYGGEFFGGEFFSTPGPTPPDENVIRNFSLRNWRKWRRDDEELPPIEQGALPDALRVEADAAVAQVVRAAIAQDGAALLAAMEARARYENAYREAYQHEYVAEIVAELWKADMKRMMRRRKAALLLLN